MKEYDWLKDLVEIIERMKTQNILMNIPSYKCSKKCFLFYTKRLRN